MSMDDELKDMAVIEIYDCFERRYAAIFAQLQSQMEALGLRLRHPERFPHPMMYTEGENLGYHEDFFWVSGSVNCQAATLAEALSKTGTHLFINGRLAFVWREGVGWCDKSLLSEEDQRLAEHHHVFFYNNMLRASLRSRLAKVIDSSFADANVQNREAVLEECRRLVRERKKIEAIKYLRDKTGFSLIEARDAIENLDGV